MRNLQNMMYNYTNPGNGVHADIPAAGLKWYLLLIYTNFRKLIYLNLLFLLFCIPIITIPAAFAGFNRVLSKLARDGTCFLWQDFWSDFKENFIKGMPIIALWCVICLMIYYNTCCFKADSGLLFYFIEGICFFAAACVFMVSSYAFYMLVNVNLPVKTVIKNAILLLFIAKGKKRYLFIIFIAYVIEILFIPYSIPLLIIIFPACQQLAVCIVVKCDIEKYIIVKSNDFL